MKLTEQYAELQKNARDFVDKALDRIRLIYEILDAKRTALKAELQLDADLVKAIQMQDQTVKGVAVDVGYATARALCLEPQASSLISGVSEINRLGERIKSENSLALPLGFPPTVGRQSEAFCLETRPRYASDDCDDEGSDVSSRFTAGKQGVELLDCPEDQIVVIIDAMFKQITAAKLERLRRNAKLVASGTVATQAHRLICAKCGAFVGWNSIFCSECGAQLQEKPEV